MEREGFAPHRPGAAADLPPPNAQPQPQPYWYPPPPPPPPPPSYHHQQWPPPHTPHNQQWPPPPPPHGPHPHAYPPAPAPPPQHMPPYPPPHQPWPNQPWPPHQGQQHYPGPSIPQNDGEDWAAKAKAWAAANSTSGRPLVDHTYLQQNEVTHANGEAPTASTQNINAGLGPALPTAPADPPTLLSPVKTFDSFSAVYEQEVPSYSSSQGTRDHQPFPGPPIQDRFYHQQSDPPYVVNYGHNVHAGPVGMAGHDPAAAPHLWPSAGSGGAYPPPNVPPHPAQQYDIPTAVHPSMPLPNYPHIPPAPFNAPPVASHHNTELYHGDPTALTQVNQTKKSAVPSWLREEILKTKTTLGSNPSAQVGSDGGERSPQATDQTDSRSVDSTKSAEDDHDEDEVEAARTVAINQEIKRILTEVLLKVTDDLFDEIATKVLSEDDMASEGTSDSTSLVKSKAHGSAPSISANTKTQHTSANGSATKAKAVVHDASTKGGGVLLGLSDYDTDDDDDDENASIERIKQSLEPTTDNYTTLMKKDVLSDQNLVNSEESTELKPKFEDAEVLAHSERIADTRFEEESHAREIPHVEVETDRAIKGEISHRGLVDGNGNIEKAKVVMNSDYGFEDKIEIKKDVSGNDMRDKEVKSKEQGDEMMDGNILEENMQKTSEDDRDAGRKEDKENKLDDLKGSKREISKEEKKQKPERDGKDEKGKSKEEKERKTERRDDKEDNAKDRREKSREEKVKRAERRDDGEHSLRGKSDRSKEDRAREMDKKDDKERLRRSRRSRSPRGRSRSKEHSWASREHSESTKRRRTDSNKRSMSRSPPRSRHRRDSRSPHSKHSHHRNSAYSTTDRRRSRSRTPSRRQRSRSRSRTPSRRR